MKKYTEEERKIAKKRDNDNYYATQKGRAKCLLQRYNKADEEHNRGKGDLTRQWIIEHIFTQPCVHCGETDWHKLGCNRLDNSLPHTMNNVEPCCWKCNREIEWNAKCKKVYQYTLEGEFVKEWPSINEAGRNGFCYKHISSCCLGRRKTHKGYIWSYVPL